MDILCCSSNLFDSLQRLVLTLEGQFMAPLMSAGGVAGNFISRCHRVLPAAGHWAEAQPHEQIAPQRGRPAQGPQIHPHRAPARALQGAPHQSSILPPKLPSPLNNIVRWRLKSFEGRLCSTAAVSAQDEVRALGRLPALNVPEAFITRHPFPGVHPHLFSYDTPSQLLRDGTYTHLPSFCTPGSDGL